MKYLFNIQQVKEYICNNTDGSYFFYNDQKYLICGKTNWEQKNGDFSKNPYKEISTLVTTLIIKEVETKLAVCGILQVANRFVSVKRKDSEFYGLIGGKSELGETIEEALLREVKEETGFNVTINYKSYPFVQEDGDFLVLCYLLNLSNNDHVNIKDGENPFLYLLTKDQLIQYSPFSEYNEKVFKWFNL